MRQMVSVAVVAALLVAAVAAIRVAAQAPALHDLLPTAENVGPEFFVVDDRARTLDEQALAFSNPEEAARLLASWGWQDNAFQVFQAAGAASVATIDISLTRFAGAEDAAVALDYFLEDRAAVLGQFENFGLAQTVSPVGDEMRVVTGDVEGGFDTTFYVRSGALLMRISATGTSGMPHTTPEQIAQDIVGRFAGFAQPQRVSIGRSAGMTLPDSLPALGESCSPVPGDGEEGVTAIIERFDGVRDADATLRAMGWLDGVARQIACDGPAVGGVGWVTMSVLRFGDAQAAAEAVPFLADARQRVTRLQSAEAPGLGDTAAALAGPAVNGTEFTLFVSDGPLLYRVTGVAPEGDPRKDVEAIASELAALPFTAPAEAPAAPLVPVDVAPTMPALVTATPMPTLVPATAMPIPTATAVPPTPAPTATALPTATATTVATATPLPTATATPDAPPLIPVDVPPQATEAPGPLPTPTPRVIHIPTPDAD